MTDSVLKQDFLTTPQMDFNSSNLIKLSKAAETACTLPCASNVFNANLQSFMHQKSSKHTKSDSNVIIAPLEVVNNDGNASQNLITKFHDNIQKVAQISIKSSFVAEPTIMPRAYVYYDVEYDKKVSTPESHSPTLLDQVFTKTENEDVSCVTTGTYVDSDAALQQDVVSTHRGGSRVWKEGGHLAEKQLKTKKKKKKKKKVTTIIAGDPLHNISHLLCKIKSYL